MKRIIFWIVFLCATSGVFAYLWKTKDPMRNYLPLLDKWTRYNIELIAHPHPAIAHDAWMEVWNLFFTKWAVYQMLPEYANDTRPISFLIEREQFPDAGDKTPAMYGFFARSKPFYYKTEKIYCRTVGEAILAVLYREKRWKVDYQDDWKAWWEANKKYY